jgi:hypothetical protein
LDRTDHAIDGFGDEGKCRQRCCTIAQAIRRPVAPRRPEARVEQLLDRYAPVATTSQPGVADADASKSARRPAGRRAASPHRRIGTSPAHDLGK